MGFCLPGIFRTVHLRRHDRGQRGATAVEMALIAPAFFLLLWGTVEISLIETAQQLLENAAYNTSRLAKTGYTTSGKTQLETVSQDMTNELQSYGTFIDTSKVTMTATDYSSFNSINAGGGTSGLGQAQQIVVYTVTYPWKFFTPMIGSLIGTKDSSGNWVINLTARIVVRNEPYG